VIPTISFGVLAEWVIGSFLAGAMLGGAFVLILFLRKRNK